MIKIIKEGIKEFRATCPFCHCEFTYEIEDLYVDIVTCPCCGAMLEAKSHTRAMPHQPIKDDVVTDSLESGKLQEAAHFAAKQLCHTEINTKSFNPCETCPHNLRLKMGETYVGDSPCQWCQYSGLRVTCTSARTSTNGVK